MIPNLVLQRPPKPARSIPMKGDDNTAWHRWRDACDYCCHSHPERGCARLGIVRYRDGAESGFPLIPGGCKYWATNIVPLKREAAEGSIRDQIERLCLQDEARRSEVA